MKIGKILQKGGLFMKRFLGFFIAILLVPGAFPACAPSDSDTNATTTTTTTTTVIDNSPAVTFVDVDVEKAVREELKKPEGAITENDLLLVTALGVSGNNTTLTDLYRMPNIEHISFRGISENLDMTPVKSLKKLRGFSTLLGDLEDISFLEGLTGLETLYVGKNAITDISILRQLTKLKEIDLRQNLFELDDMTIFSQMTDLEYLSIECVHIRSLNGIETLKNLKSLNIYDTGFGEISPLLELTQLEKLWLCSCDIAQEDVDTLKKSLPDCEIYVNQ